MLLGPRAGPVPGSAPARRSLPAATCTAQVTSSGSSAPKGDEQPPKFLYADENPPVRCGVAGGAGGPQRLLPAGTDSTLCCARASLTAPAAAALHRARPQPPRDTMSPEMKARLRKEYYGLGGAPNQSMGGVRALARAGGCRGSAACCCALQQGAGWPRCGWLLDAAGRRWPRAEVLQASALAPLPCSAASTAARTPIAPPLPCITSAAAELLPVHHPGHLAAGGAQQADGRHLTPLYPHPRAGFPVSPTRAIASIDSRGYER